ncbi:MAG: methyltransferase type 11 [Ignavibacteria bacterium]|nr:MAG: methyltransferase type 11 [Ignavibacteria bacterium]KAF0156679.1 MAG: methyltransferase type 11 [Ignavibacteria bacterium]
MLDNKNFYNSASSFYDQMINFEANLRVRRDAFAKLFPSTGIVADLGCGTGVDSIALALNGHTVTGFDPSPQMLETAKINSEKYSLRIEFAESTILSTPVSFNSHFDYAISLGNTFANVEGTTIYSTVQKLYDILKPNGKGLIHILNYALIAEQKERIISIKPDEENYFVRFYDFINGQINFNILRFSKTDNSSFTLLTTQVYGYKKDLLAKVCESVGFKDIKYTSDLEGNPFDILSSKDLFILAAK